MAYDDVLILMGEFGRYQRKTYFILCIPAIFCAIHKMSGVFLETTPNFRCLLPLENSTNAEYQLPDGYIDAFLPKHSATTTKKERPSQCHFYDIPVPPNVTNLEEYYLIAANSTKTWNEKNCETYVFDKMRYSSTVATKWNMVCDSSWWISTGDSIFMVGVMIGSMTFGFLSDKFGRKPIFVICLIIQLISGTIVGLAPNYATFVVFRAILGSTASGVFIVTYVIALEMVGPKKRIYAGVGVNLFFTIGYFTTGIFAYFIRDWRTLQIALVLPSVLFLSYYWFIPESCRWLLTKGRKEEAKALLHKAAKANGVDISDDTMEALLSQKETESKNSEAKSSALDLIRYPNLRRKTLLLCFNWLINSGTYYGLSWGAAKLSDNEFATYFMSAGVEIPAYILLMCTLNRWGRKAILCGSMITSGFFLLLMTVVPKDMGWLAITFYMLSKLAITASYGAIYIFTTEQFPTVVRNIGLGVSSTCAKLGGVCAPQINLLGEIWFPFPHVFYGTLALCAGLITLLLPETLNKRLPDTIEEGENFGRQTKNVSLQSLTPTKKGVDDNLNGKIA
ncbi:organic cation transporter protein-like [Leptopilina heterotoma]|uniref:organic cation transporter protein-like n=1 Tax=Leptopilina heterotoma TaxID=63436 RepID=UPI001CA808C8|nr:organic cation transporter protein-like [Leptopilina heterotoma]XP_043470045.1 organic cation transporter protein-like [Leptopilina heterotoma]